MKSFAVKNPTHTRSKKLKGRDTQNGAAALLWASWFFDPRGNEKAQKLSLNRQVPGHPGK